jgi:hypothetical protein
LYQVLVTNFSGVSIPKILTVFAFQLIKTLKVSPSLTETTLYGPVLVTQLLVNVWFFIVFEL